MSGIATQELTWQAIAHRALACAAIYGLLDKSKTAPRVRVGSLGALSAAPADDAGEIAVVIDDGTAPDVAFSAARGRRVLGLVVASTAAVALVSAAREDRSLGEASKDRAERTNDGWPRALVWAVNVSGPLVPPVRAERLVHVARAASEAGFSLVEPEPPPRLARVRMPAATSLDRAVLATFALGATARPLFFVEASRAPKGGLAKLRLERLTDGWIRGRRAPAREATSLEEAALAALGTEAPRALSFKETLREARARWTALVRSRGERASVGSDDGPRVARALYEASIRDEIEVFVADPSTPLALARFSA